VLSGVLADRTLTLRTADSRGFSKEELEARERVRLKCEQLQRIKLQKEKSDRQFISAPGFGEENDDQDSEVNELNVESDTDSDWEDMPKDTIENEDGSKSSYNTTAKLGNALMKDLGLVKKESTSLLLCPSKVRRERKRWGGKLEEEHLAQSLPHGLYSDGKCVDTLVRDTVTTRVQVPGRRGRAAFREVTIVSNKVEKQEHFVVVSEPGEKYCSHVTPYNGSGAAIARELVAVVRERGVQLQVLGMDGCSVNCGIHNGVFRLLELDLGYSVQHCVCLIHLNELPIRHYFIMMDGVTSGPG
jgi:hypothetical protein